MKTTGLWVGMLLGMLTGCTTEQLRFKGDDEPKEKPAVETIGTVTTVRGTGEVNVYGVGIVQGLQGTGHDPQPGEMRRKALRMLAQHGVEDGERFLASGSAAVVKVAGTIHAGTRKGDHFDVIISLDPNDKGTSLRGGYLLDCELREYTNLEEISREGAKGTLPGKVWAKAEGPVLVDISKTGDKADERVGRVWGGGRATQERNFALLLDSKHQDARLAKLIGERINERFFTNVNGTVRGMAEAKNNTAITLRIPEVYHHNWQRFLRVVRQIPLRETPGGRALYERELADDLLDPAKAVTAALKLEALGVESAKSDLRKALTSTYPIVRFCAAEALAYVGDPACARPLADIIRQEPALRAYALTALASLDEAICQVELRDLMMEPSAETRFGAFRALRTLNSKDPMVQGERLSDSFYLHRVAPGSPALVHVCTSQRPEVVLFGQDSALLPPFSLTAGMPFVVTAREGEDRCLITHVTAQATKEQEYSPLQLDEVIRKLGQMGASYSDVVDLLQQAVRGQNLSAPFAMDALPKAPTVYEIAAAGAAAKANGPATADLGGTPNLFAAPTRK